MAGRRHARVVRVLLVMVEDHLREPPDRRDRIHMAHFELPLRIPDHAVVTSG